MEEKNITELFDHRGKIVQFAFIFQQMANKNRREKLFKLLENGSKEKKTQRKDRLSLTLRASIQN